MQTEKPQSNEPLKPTEVKLRDGWTPEMLRRGKEVAAQARAAIVAHMRKQILTGQNGL
jgi:hypothetical protein